MGVRAWEINPRALLQLFFSDENSGRKRKVRLVPTWTDKRGSAATDLYKTRR